MSEREAAGYGAGLKAQIDVLSARRRAPQEIAPSAEVAPDQAPNGGETP